MYGSSLIEWGIQGHGSSLNEWDIQGKAVYLLDGIVTTWTKDYYSRTMAWWI